MDENSLQCPRVTSDRPHVISIVFWLDLFKIICTLHILHEWKWYLTTFNLFDAHYLIDLLTLTKASENKN